MTRQSAPDVAAFAADQRAEYDRFTQTLKRAPNGAP